MSIHLLKVKKLHPDAILPTRATNGSAGWDLYSMRYFRVRGAPGTSEPLGIAIEIPNGHVGLICPRSGLAANFGVTVLNAPGIVDSDYRGEVSVLLVNHGRYPEYIRAGDRIAQLLIVPIADAQILEVEELSPTTRGNRGFGSSGR